MTQKNRRILIVCVAILIVIALAIVSYIKNTSETNTGSLQVTTSFYPLFFFAKTIGGSNVSVTNITPSGTEPHDYEPTTSDIIHIEQSKLLLLNGGGLEPWAKKIQDITDSKLTILTVGSDLAAETVNEGGTLVADPHIWLSPKTSQKIVQKISDALVVIDPEHALEYQENTNTLLRELQSLDEKFQTQLTSCKTRSFVTSHDAFGYLARDYNLQQVPITGLSPDMEPSQKDLTVIADFVKKNNIHYIFFESLLSPKLSETLAQETNTQTLVLDPLESLPQKDADAGKNYFTVMEQNLANLKIALQCTM